MSLLILIGLCILFFLTVLGIYVYLRIRQNKYYFWKYTLFVPDRNGCRKPGERKVKLFGESSPVTGVPQTEVLSKTMERIDIPPRKAFVVNIDESRPEYEIAFDDVILGNGGIRVYSEGHLYSSIPEDIDPKDELKVFPLKIKSVKTDKGKDHLGEYDLYMVSWYSQNKEVLILTSIRVYKDPSCVIFRVEFPMGVPQTSTGSYSEPCVEFPVFRNYSNRSLVFTYSQTNFSEPRNEFVPTSAPVLFYNLSLDTMIFSPTMNFLISWNCPGDDGLEIRMGIEGKIEYLPPNFMHESILYADKGITNTFKRWGDILLRYYQKTRFDPQADIALRVLGYWTDAGTYYYYNHAPYENYEDLLLALKNKADELSIPYGYIQLDSWFYPKDDGTLKWDADPSLLPHGIRYLVEKTQLPVVCHNRWFSRNSPYIKEYSNWIIETHANPSKPKIDMSQAVSKWDSKTKEKDKRTWALCMDPVFWNSIISNAHWWGCICYEQDWLQSQWRFFEALHKDVYQGRYWLKLISDATSAYGLTVQYCMTFPSFYLATLEFSNVSHARCSDDYNHLKPKRIYIPHFTQTSLLSWSVGVWPWKDSFLGVCEPKPGSLKPFEKIPPHYERWGELELLLQVLSGGPVGNGDKITNLNRDLLLQSCREDGLLIKPDRPAFPIDLMFLPHHKPYIISTYSKIQGARWWYILEVLVWKHTVREYFVTLEELGIKGKYVLYDYKKRLLRPIGPQEPIGSISKMKLNEFQYYVLAPIVSNGMAFVGFSDKYVTMSSLVFEKCMVVGRSLHVEGLYTPRQEFTVMAYVPNKPQRVTVNGMETDKYTWGPNYKTLILRVFTDDGHFSISIT